MSKTLVKEIRPGGPFAVFYSVDGETIKISNEDYTMIKEMEKDLEERIDEFLRNKYLISLSKK